MVVPHDLGLSDVTVELPIELGIAVELAVELLKAEQWSLAYDGQDWFLDLRTGSEQIVLSKPIADRLIALPEMKRCRFGYIWRE